jgi:hypothetical protein
MQWTYRLAIDLSVASARPLTVSQIINIKQMPNQFVGHVDRWLLLSESEVDYPLLFVRAWIPFNAWYCTNYQTTRDRVCIDKIKTDANLFRAKLVALLMGDYDEAIIFKEHLENLHNLLERHPIPDSDPNNRLTFKNVYFRRNPIHSTHPPISNNKYQYKAEVITETGAVKVIILNTRQSPPSTIYTYNHSKYDSSHFKDDLTENVKNKTHQKILIECFDKINPKIKENIISKGKKSLIKGKKIHFVDNANDVSQAIIEVLYELRCKLFHGEIQPSKDNFSVYEPCYQMLRILLKSLK